MGDDNASKYGAQARDDASRITDLQADDDTLIEQEHEPGDDTFLDDFRKQFMDGVFEKYATVANPEEVDFFVNIFDKIWKAGKPPELSIPSPSLGPDSPTGQAADSAADDINLDEIRMSPGSSDLVEEFLRPDAYIHPGNSGNRQASDAEQSNANLAGIDLDDLRKWKGPRVHNAGPVYPQLSSGALIQPVISVDQPPIKTQMARFLDRALQRSNRIYSKLSGDSSVRDAIYAVLGIRSATWVAAPADSLQLAELINMAAQVLVMTRKALQFSTLVLDAELCWESLAKDNSEALDLMPDDNIQQP